jgi:hypothetical protein
VEQGRTNVLYWLKFEDKKLVLPIVGSLNKGVGASYDWCPKTRELVLPRVGALKQGSWCFLGLKP